MSKEILPKEVADDFKLKASSARVLLPNNEEVDFSSIAPEKADYLSRMHPELIEKKAAKVVETAKKPADSGKK